MAVLDITFSVDNLIALAREESHQVAAAIRKKEGDSKEDLAISADDEGQVIRILCQADWVVREKITFLLDPIAEDETPPMQEDGALVMNYRIVPAYRLHRSHLPDMIERVLVGYLLREWFLQRGVLADVPLERMLEELKSFALKTDQRIVRKRISY